MTKNSIPNFDTEIAKFQPKQVSALDHLDSGMIKFLLYGGALGGGKSYFLRWYAVRRLMILFSWGFKGAVGMIACENYPSLKDRQISKIGVEFPSWLGKYYDKHKLYSSCFILDKRWGSGVICFRNLDDPAKYASSEFAFILVDELTKNKIEVFTFLRTRLRWPGLPDVECQFVGASNPGSVGHGWVKALWMDGVFGKEWIEPIDYRGMFAYVPSTAADNKYLGDDYWAMLSSLPENIREAFKDGNWNVFVGQAFPQFNRETHVIRPTKIPENAPMYTTFDWGYGKPFSWGWWWVDTDGRIYRFAEWYGWCDIPNEGLRLSDKDIAIGVLEREKQLGIKRSQITASLAGHDCWNKKPDYKGGGQGPSTADVFASFGIYMTPGDSSRALKIRQFRERLRVPTDGSMPMMMISNTCKQFIRTISDLVVDENNIEDVETDGEDHCIAGGTMVCTPWGLIAIRDLVGTHGLVLTAGGYWTDFDGCSLTRRDAETVKVSFSDGRSITCTPDHKFLTKKGYWVSAKWLLDEECHDSIGLKKHIKEALSCGSKSSAIQRRSLTANGTGCAGSIINAKGRGYIGQFGNTTTALSPMEHTFTTETKTDQTTSQRTSNAIGPRDTCRYMPGKTTIRPGKPPCVKARRSGIEAMRAANGTKNSTKNTARRLLTRWSENHANTVALNSKVKNTPGSVLAVVSRRIGTNRNDLNGSAPFAVWRLSEADALVRNLVLQDSHGRSARVVSVTPSGRQDVYCLNAAITHAFAVEGGIVVHNCYDEAALLCMYRPLSLEMPEAPKASHDKRIENLYRGDQDDYEENAAYEQEWAMRYLGAGESDIDAEEYDDGDLVRTI
jgi:hypothetical protein